MKRSFVRCLISSVCLVCFVGASEASDEKQTSVPYAAFLSGPDIGASSKAAMPAELAQTLLRRRPDWINAWQFLGLTKDELNAKVLSLSKQREPSYIPLKLASDGKSVNLGDGYVGKAYEFEYENDKIVRARALIYTCTTPERKYRWVSDRTEGLNQSLREYNSYIDGKHRELEKHLSGIRDSDKSSLKPAWIITSDLAYLRDLYLKRAELLRELGQNADDAEYLARDVHVQFEKWKSKLSPSDKRDWVRWKLD